MNIAELKDWGALISLVVGAMVGIVTTAVGIVYWLTGREAVVKDRINTLESDMGKQMDALAERQTKLEARVNVVPTHEDLRKQYEAMLRQTEKLDQLIGRMEAREKIIDAMHQHLLEKSK